MEVMLNYEHGIILILYFDHLNKWIKLFEILEDTPDEFLLKDNFIFNFYTGLQQIPKKLLIQMKTHLKRSYSSVIIATIDLKRGQI